MKNFAHCWKISLIWWGFFLAVGALWQFVWPVIGTTILLFVQGLL